MLSLYSKSRKEDSELNNDGFLLFDSMLALLIFTFIVLLLPGLIFISSTDQLSLEQLKVYREMYVMSTRYDDPHDYIKAAEEIFDKAGIPCDERLKKICD